MDLVWDLIQAGRAFDGGVLALESGFDADLQLDPALLLQLAEELGDEALNMFGPFEDAYGAGLQALEDAADLLNCSGFGIQQVLFILSQLEQTVDNLQNAIEAGVADNPLMQTFAPDLGADIKRFTSRFDTAEQALADLRELGEGALPWNLIPTINSVLPEFLSLELKFRPIFDAYFCVANLDNEGLKQVRLDTSARYTNALGGPITYLIPDSFELNGEDRDEFKKWASEMAQLNLMTIRRTYFSSGVDKVDLHIFSDASL